MPLGHADAPPFQIFRFVDAGMDVDVGAGVAEFAVDESRYADERKIAAGFAGDETAEGHFRRVELMMHAHAPVHLGRPVDRDKIDFQSFGAHRAVF